MPKMPSGMHCCKRSRPTRPICFATSHMGLVPQRVPARTDGRGTAGQSPPRLRIWSAACSTGDEPTTVACCIAACLPDPLLWRIQILGTDIGVGALQEAKRATFGQRAMQHVPEEYCRRFFLKAKDSPSSARPARADRYDHLPPAQLDGAARRKAVRPGAAEERADLLRRGLQDHGVASPAPGPWCRAGCCWPARPKACPTCWPISSASNPGCSVNQLRNPTRR